MLPYQLTPSISIQIRPTPFALVISLIRERFSNTKGGTLKSLEPETSSSHENKVHAYEQHSILRYVYSMSRIQPNSPNSIQPNRDLIEEPSKETGNPITNYTVTAKVMLTRALHSSTTKPAELKIPWLVFSKLL